jgi:hypothetical protein
MSKTLQYNGGQVIVNAKIQLIYWGSSWNNFGNDPSKDSFDHAVRALLNSNYYSKVHQYSSIEFPTWQGSIVNTITPTSPLFSGGAVVQAIRDVIDAGLVPNPSSDSQLIYCIIAPSGAHVQHSREVSGENIGGEHGHWPEHDPQFHYLWILNDNNLNNMTGYIGHEIVETITNPNGDGWNSDEGEIGDLCEHDTGTVIPGIVTQYYWSNADNNCVLPIGTREV